MVMYGALLISGVAGRWVVVVDAGDQIGSAGHQGSGALQPGTLQIVLGGVIAATFAVLLTEGVAGYVFFGFKAPEMFALAFLALAGVAWRHGAKGWLALYPRPASWHVCCGTGFRGAALCIRQSRYYDKYHFYPATHRLCGAARYG